METKNKTSTFAEIWDTLSQVNVNDYTDTKGDKTKLTYLSWANGWKALMDNYPQATYRYLPRIKYPDGTEEVICVVEIDGNSREMSLPVMNYANQPIANPNSWQVNTSKMRCLVKAIAMFGLALYIYRGEDLPDEDVNVVVNVIDDSLKKLEKAKKKDKKQVFETLFKEDKINEKTDPRQLAKSLSVA
tara:strand:- start:2770 stop:3333 length:564 start_codon:yes stop_codon:yes gene_type:complete